MGPALRFALVLAFVLIAALIAQRLLQRDVRPAVLAAGAASATRPVTVKDVIAADIPSPVRSRVSFPACAYATAHPGATDGAEITIAAFAEAPDLAARTRLPREDPEWLPPVAERLPINPAVVRGPDGIGVYGGEWRQCTPRFDVATKIGYESFVRFDPSGRLQPGLAYRWEVSPDNRVFTFHLRKGHRYSDGSPFTARDLAWTANVVIGSPCWAPPDWMRPTDGTVRIHAQEVLDWRGLATRLLGDGALPAHARSLLGSEAVARLAPLAAGQNAGDDLLVDALNRMLRDPAFFRAADWADDVFAPGLAAATAPGWSRFDRAGFERVRWQLEGQALLAQAKAGKELPAADRSRLNVLLFRAAFAPTVAPAEKRRVRVEAVDDGTGDDSHIIRFTFDRPNAIFLEKTATFMFYTGFFGAASAQRPVHVDGQVEFADSDVLDWAGLAAALPASPLAALLTEAERSVFAAAEATARRPALAALNRIAAGDGILDPALRAGLDLDAELAALRQRDVLSYSTSDWKRFEELNDRAHLLQRLAADGAAALTGAERLRLGVALVRAHLPATAFAVNREAGLNHAAQNGPRKYTNWITAWRGKSNFHPVHNPHVPVLTAWRIVTEAKERRQLAIRNPFYYKVDERGNQLPYIDRLVCELEQQHSVHLLKLRSGNVDFQVRELKFEDYTVLKQNEQAGGYEIRLWANDYCGEVNFWPLQTHRDPQYRRLFTDRRFRQALSLALNRQQIIDVAFHGLGTPAQFSIPEGSPYYNAKLAKAFIAHDPARANALLDEIGLTQRSADGMRRFWDGTPITLDVNTGGEVPQEVVQLACNAWQAIGLNAQLKFRQGGMITRMVDMGTADIVTAWEGGNFFGPLLAGAFAPTHPAEARQWTAWTKHIMGDVRAGEEPPPWLVDINRTWESLIASPDQAAKMRAWQALTDRAAEDLPVIGVMTSPGKLVYVRNGFKNVPRLALAGWIAHDPGNACPEVFFHANPAGR